MNNYLLQLLKEVKTLIIPGLGALTVTNEATGEILFMPYLKFDDGTLAKHIASKEGIEQNDASNMISKFVREVTVELDKGNSYDMYQFGRFVKVDGEIAFEAWSAGNGGQQVAPEAPKQEPEKAPLSKTEVSSGKDEKPKEESIPKAEEPKAEIPPVVEPVKEAPKPVEPKIEKIVPPVAETPKTEPKAEKTPPPVVEEPKVEAQKIEKTVPPVVEPKKEAVKQEAKKEPSKKEKPVKAEKAPKEKRKTSVFSYILWGFLVLVLGAGTFIAIQFDSLKKDFPILADLAGENDDAAKGSEEVKQLEEDPDASTDSAESEPIPEDQVQIVEDRLPAEKPVEEPKKEEKAKPKETPKPKVEVTVNKKPVAKPKSQNTGSTASFDGSKHFHIIAGSFGSEANANRLAGKLQAKGFGEASVTMNGGMYRVSVKGFATLNEATAEAASIQSSVPGAWVLKM